MEVKTARSKLPYSLIPTQSLARSHCQARADLIVGKRIHSGKSNVFEGCTDDTNCPYVIKVKAFYDQNGLNAFLQQQFFAQYVNEEWRARKTSTSKIRTSITPQIHDVWTCHEPTDETVVEMSGFMVMDRMEGTLAEYIRKYASVIDLTQITMYLLELFYFLASLSILHQNITLNNIVYRGAQGTLELFIIDWDKIVWKKDKKLTEKYDRILKGLLSEMEREQKRLLKCPRTVSIRPLSELPPFTSFRAIQTPLPFRSASLSPGFMAEIPSFGSPSPSFEFKQPIFTFSSSETPQLPPPLLLPVEDEDEEYEIPDDAGGSEEPQEYLPPVD